MGSTTGAFYRGAVQQAIDRIKAAVPSRPVANTVDTVEIGDASKPLRAVATKVFATSEVIQRFAGVRRTWSRIGIAGGQVRITGLSKGGVDVLVCALAGIDKA